MTTEIIGEQSLFAIEHAKQTGENPNLRAVRLWMNGLPFGTLNDETYIPSFREQLERLVHPSPLGIDEMFEDDRALISLGDTFDDFVMRRVLSDDKLIFTVELVDEPFFVHPLLKKGTRYGCTVPLQYAQKIVSEFNQQKQ